MKVQLRTFLSLFKDQKKAYRIVLHITSEHRLYIEFKGSLHRLYEHLKEAQDPDRSFLHFHDFIVNSTAKSTIFELLISFKVVGEILFGIFSQSETLSVFLINNPEYLFWLIENETLANKKSKEDYYIEAKKLIDSTSNIAKKEYLLRHFRKREYLRIATREIVNACPFEEVLEELSDLADALVEIALDVAYLKIKSEPKKEGFCVIGLGKLGNRELNFSSDIDLIFVHRDEKRREFYNKLASQLVSMLSENKEGGFVYRVDTRLRPGGFSHPLSMSLDEYENYYYTFGQPWERISLVKARPVAGDEKLGKAFIKLIEPFVFPKSLDIEYIKEIRGLMFKIHKSFDKKDCYLPKEIQDVKKGVGGIREIEFVVNYFQLILGGKNETLRHVSTYKGLELLQGMGLLEEASKLKSIYMFFRRIEHKLQLKQEKQTQILPCEKEDLEFLAKTLGMGFDDFVEKYTQDTSFVHAVFKRIFMESSGLPIFSSLDDIEGYLVETGLKNSTKVSKLIVDTVKKYIASGINKERIQRTFDYAFNMVKDIGFFDQVAVGLNKINPTYIDTILDSNELFKLFIKVLALGYGERLTKNPQLLDTFLAPSKLEFENLTKEEKERIEFEITLKLLSGNYNHGDLRYTTNFALKFIKSVCEKVDADRKTAVVGYGKLATGELFVGSDLDIVFVCENEPYKYEKTVVKIIREIKKLYDVDLRLRPFGDKGSLVIDIEYLKKYFEKDASSWEKQAAQKSRVVYCGFERERLERVYEDFVLNNPPSKDEIWSMFKKIEENKGKGLDIKSSKGCLTNIEFLVQAVCFEKGCIEYSKGILELIEKLKILPVSEIKEAYLFFFKVLNALRVTNRSSKIDENGVRILEFLLDEHDILEKIEHFRLIVDGLNKEVFG